MSSEIKQQQQLNNQTKTLSSTITNPNLSQEQPKSDPDLDYLLKKRRSDGSLIKTRQEMLKAYHDSNLPYPFSAIFNLTYCKNIIKSHFFNSIFFAMPLSMVISYTLNPEIRTKGYMSRSKYYYFSIYMLTYAVLFGGFSVDALLFCDYCKPWSDVYLVDGRTQKYKEILKNRIKNEQKSTDVQIQKTRDYGLKDNEI